MAPVLTDRCLTDEELRDVYERYGAFVHRRAFFYLKSKEAAEAVTVEVFSSLRRKYGRMLLTLRLPRPRILWLEWLTSRACKAWRRDPRRLS